MGLYTLDDCQWWFLNDGIFITGWSRFFAMLLLGIFFTALARWDHDPWRWCRCVHSMFYLTWFFHIHITIHNYTNLYQFIYQSISFYIIYLWFTWFIWFIIGFIETRIVDMKHEGTDLPCGNQTWQSKVTYLFIVVQLQRIARS